MNKSIRMFALLGVVISAIVVLSGCKIANETKEELREFKAEKNALLNSDSATEKSGDVAGMSGKNSVKEENFIGEDKAKEIALQKAELTAEEVSFAGVELDRDDGIWKYEVEFYEGRTEYSFDVNAETGEIVSWDIDNDD